MPYSRRISGLFLGALLVVTTPARAEDLTFTTYYPAPAAGGSGTEVRTNQASVGSQVKTVPLVDGQLVAQGPVDLGLGTGQLRLTAQTSGTPWGLLLAQPTTSGWISVLAAYPKGAPTASAHGVQNVGSGLELMGTDYAADPSHYHDCILLAGSNRIGFVSRATGTKSPGVYEVAPDFVFTSTSNTLGERDLMAITAAGSVGIGTTNPSAGSAGSTQPYRLDVEGSLDRVNPVALFRGAGEMWGGYGYAQIVAQSHSYYPGIGFKNLNGEFMGLIRGVTGASPNDGLEIVTGLPTSPNRVANFTAAGNVGIGTAIPAASAKLDVTSTTQGLLPPRLTTAQRDAIAAPAAGLLIYNTTTNQLDVYNGSAWVAGAGAAVPKIASGLVNLAYAAASGGFQNTFTMPAGTTQILSVVITPQERLGPGGGSGWALMSFVTNVSVVSGQGRFTAYFHSTNGLYYSNPYYWIAVCQ